jgi:hypothetical protein
MPINNTMFLITVCFLVLLTLSNANTEYKQFVTYDYKILTHPYEYTFEEMHTIDFSREVRSYLNSGWEIAGSLIHERSIFSNINYFMQPMMKKIITNVTEIYLEGF